MPNKVYIAGRNQTKTVTPSNVQQTIEPDSGYNALDAVVVNPIAAAMPENIEKLVMRDNTMPPFSLSLSGNVPAYACYEQSKLVAVYGEITSIGESAFRGCTGLQEVNGQNITTIGTTGFFNCSNLNSLDCRNAISIGNYALQNCISLRYIDCRNIQSIGGSILGGSPNVLLLDITNTHSATMSNATSIEGTHLTVLVADATDKAYYQSATNWSTHASKIKTVAEFEAEIGMSYDEYYLQVFGHPRNEALT